MPPSSASVQELGHFLAKHPLVIFLGLAQTLEEVGDFVVTGVIESAGIEIVGAGLGIHRDVKGLPQGHIVGDGVVIRGLDRPRNLLSVALRNVWEEAFPLIDNLVVVAFFPHRHALEEIRNLGLVVVGPVRKLLVVDCCFVLNGDRHVEHVGSSELGKIEFNGHCSLRFGPLEWRHQSTATLPRPRAVVKRQPLSALPEPGDGVRDPV